MPHATASTTIVEHFRHILVWPLQLVPSSEEQMARHWQKLGSPWRKVEDEFVSDPAQFQERHYREFVSFLPHVQHFLYGEEYEREAGRGYGQSPISVVRRGDVKGARVTLGDEAAAIELDVAHVDLYFFHDVDVVLLNVEVVARQLPLAVAQDVMFRLGRAYPAGWDEHGRALHCAKRVEWLGAEGEVIATSDFEKRERYLAAVCSNRSAEIAAHWEFLLAPMVPHQSKEVGGLRYRHTWRTTASRGWGISRCASPLRSRAPTTLGSGLIPGPVRRGCCPIPTHTSHGSRRIIVTIGSTIPSGERHQECDSHAARGGLTMVTEASPAAIDPERGLLGEFRHRYFLLFLLARFHKAALLMLSDRLAVTVNALDIADRRSVGRFAQDMRLAMESFLRFTHRYWFHQVSNQTQASLSHADEQARHGATL